MAKGEWYPWLVSELFGVGVVDLPDGNPPNPEAWTASILEAIGDDPYALARTMVIGHSAGCWPLLRALAALPPGRAVKQVLVVAGWWAVDEPQAALQPLIEPPLDYDAVKDGVQSLRVLLSTNDPYTSDHEANAALWRDRLEAEVVFAPEAGHFTGAEQPFVLAQLKELYGEL